MTSSESIDLANIEKLLSHDLPGIKISSFDHALVLGADPVVVLELENDNRFLISSGRHWRIEPNIETVQNTLKEIFKSREQVQRDINQLRLALDGLEVDIRMMGCYMLRIEINFHNYLLVVPYTPLETTKIVTLFNQNVLGGITDFKIVSENPSEEILQILLQLIDQDNDLNREYLYKEFLEAGGDGIDNSLAGLVVKIVNQQTELLIFKLTV